MKLRQTIELNLTNIEELQSEIEKFKKQSKGIEEAILEERKAHDKKLFEYENRIKEDSKILEKERKSH
jgi:hypothetical protein